MADVFISYSRNDHSLAEGLASVLQRRGLSVWWDVELMPADRFRKKISQEIESCHATVVLWSADSRESSWVLDEAKLAFDLNKLVQASIDGEALPIGFGSASINYANLSDWNPQQSHEESDKLLKAIEQFIPPRESVDALRKRLNEIEIDGNSNFKSSRVWFRVATVLGFSGILFNFFGSLELKSDFAQISEIPEIVLEGDLAKGTWCGIDTFNAGAKASFRYFVDNNSPESQFAKTIQCEGHDPKESCPDSYTRIAAAAIMIEDTLTDFMYTCIKN